MGAENFSYQIAAFIDFENVALSAVKQYGEFNLGLLLTPLKSRGRIPIKRAYADWSRQEKYRDVLREQAIELVHLYAYTPQRGGKNRADIRLAIDALEIVFTQKYIDAVAIISGDSDFSSLILKVREYGKYTIGAGVRASTSELLVKSCDEFIFYDDLITEEEDIPRRLLEAALDVASRRNLPIQATHLKQIIMQQDPAFNEKNLGYNGFCDFLEAYPELVKIYWRGKIVWVEPNQAPDRASEMSSPTIALSREPSQALIPEPQSSLPPVIRPSLDISPQTQTAAPSQEPSQVLMPEAQPSLPPVTRPSAAISPPTVPPSQEPSQALIPEPQSSATGTRPSSESSLQAVLPDREASQALIHEPQSSQPPVTRPSSEISSVPSGPNPNIIRTYLARIGVRVLSPDLRSEIIQNLAKWSTKGITPNALIDQLKNRYDRNNILRTRDDLRDLVKLVCRSGILDFGSERPSLAAMIRGLKETDHSRAKRSLEMTYVRKILEAGFKVTPSILSVALLDSEGNADYYGQLLEELVNQKVAQSSGRDYSWTISDPLGFALGDRAVLAIRNDIERLPLEKAGDISRPAADHLFEEANRERGRDFAKSADACLKAMKIMTELMRRREPGNASDELMWQAAIYCTARAGLAFRDQDFANSRKYYLGFFWLVQDGELAWEKTRLLLPPMLSFYWATITHEISVELPRIPGHTPPDEMLIELTAILLEGQGTGKIKKLAKNLAHVNAALVSNLIKQIEQEGNEPHITEAADLLHEALPTIS